MQLFARHHVPLLMDVEMPTIESIKRFVEMGMGVAIVPRMCVRNGDCSEERWWNCDQADAFPAASIFLYRRDRALSHAARAFMRVLRTR